MLENRNQLYTLISACIASFLTPFTGSAINIALPAMGQDLGASVVSLTWMSTAFMLSSAAFLLPLGRLADIAGRKKIFSIGVAIFGLASLGGGLVHSPQLLIAFRVLQGVGGACIFGTGMAILTSVFPAQMRGRVLGINSAVVYIGVSTGPVLGGLITHSLSWRYIFFISFLLSLIAQLAIARIDDRHQLPHDEQFNWMASALYTCGLVATMYGIAALTNSGFARFSLLVGLVLLFLFITYDARSHRPLINLAVLSKNRVFAYSNLAALLNYLATSGVSFLISLYLQVVKGLNPALAGFLMLSQPVIMTVVSPYSGRLSDRVEPQLVATWGMVLTAVGLAMFVICGHQTSFYYVVGALMITGLGFGLFASPNNNAIMSSVPPTQYGLASSTLSTSRLIGQTLSMTIVTLVIAAVMGNIQVSPRHADQFIKALRITMILFTASTIPGILASRARGHLHDDSTENQIE